jgi:hypothetical protein
LVIGFRTGAGATGLSARMLYQNFGISVSFRRKRVCVDMDSLLELNGSDSYGMYDAGNEFFTSP